MIRLCAFADEAANDLAGQIAALKRNDIALLELRSVDGKNVADFTESEASEYAKTLKENGIAVWSIGSPLGKSEIEEDGERYRKRVEKVCRIARVFGTERVRVFSFFHAYDKRESVVERLQETVDIAARHGVLICHENEKEIYGDTLARTLDLLAAVKGLRAVYDPANFIQCGECAKDTIPALFDKIDYFHIKDTIRESGELVPAGYGDGEIDEIIRRVKSDTVFTLEPHLAAFDAYRSIDNTEMKHKFRFKTAGEAFDAAARALKTLLSENGSREEDHAFIK